MTKDKYAPYNKKWYEAHKDDPEYKARRDATTKRWIKNNRDKWNDYQREYKRTHKKGADNEQRAD